jgi:hypothetical protein
MSHALPPSVISATKGEYDIPIKRLWRETWRQLLQMPKVFWQGFGLVMLVLFGMTIFVSFFYQWVDIGLLHFQNHTAQLPNLHTLSLLNKIKAVFAQLIAGVIPVLLALLTVSFAFLALNHLRQQPIKASSVFVFLKNWQSLLLMSVLFYLLTRVSQAGLFVLFKAIHLYPLSEQDLVKPIFVLGYAVPIFLAIFLDTYFLVVAFMGSLLILDQNMTFKKSVDVAFKSINRHVLKNSALLFLPSWAYMSAWADFGRLFFSLSQGYALLAYLILLPGMFMALLFILYKKMADSTHLSRLKNITMIIIKVILVFVVLELFFSGMGLIWLLPVISLLLAIQYQHIFLDNF